MSEKSNPTPLEFLQDQDQYIVGPYSNAFSRDKKAINEDGTLKFGDDGKLKKSNHQTIVPTFEMSAGDSSRVAKKRITRRETFEVVVLEDKVKRLIKERDKEKMRAMLDVMTEQIKKYHSKEAKGEDWSRELEDVLRIKDELFKEIRFGGDLTENELATVHHESTNVDEIDSAQAEVAAVLAESVPVDQVEAEVDADYSMPIHSVDRPEQAKKGGTFRNYGNLARVALPFILTAGPNAITDTKEGSTPSKVISLGRGLLSKVGKLLPFGRKGNEAGAESIAAADGTDVRNDNETSSGSLIRNWFAQDSLVDAVDAHAGVTHPDAPPIVPTTDYSADPVSFLRYRTDDTSIYDYKDLDLSGEFDSSPVETFSFPGIGDPDPNASDYVNNYGRLDFSVNAKRSVVRRMLDRRNRNIKELQAKMNPSSGPTPPAFNPLRDPESKPEKKTWFSKRKTAVLGGLALLAIGVGGMVADEDRDGKVFDSPVPDLIPPIERPSDGDHFGDPTQIPEWVYGTPETIEASPVVVVTPPTVEVPTSTPPAYPTEVSEPEVVQVASTEAESGADAQAIADEIVAILEKPADDVSGVLVDTIEDTLERTNASKESEAPSSTDATEDDPGMVVPQGGSDPVLSASIEVAEWAGSALAGAAEVVDGEPMKEVDATSPEIISESVTIKYGEGFTDAYQHIAEENGITLSDAESFTLHKYLFDKYGADILVGAKTYPISSEPSDVGIMEPGVFTFYPEVSPDMHQKMNEIVKEREQQN